MANFFNFISLCCLLFSPIVCELGLSEVSLFVDVSTTLANNFQSEIPHIHVDFSMDSALKLLETFLLARNATDVVLIAQDTEMADEMLNYNLKSQSPLRFLVLNVEDDEKSIASIAQRLHSLRPSPDLIVLVAESDRMKGIFFDVSLILKFSSLMDDRQQCDKGGNPFLAICVFSMFFFSSITKSYKVHRSLCSPSKALELDVHRPSSAKEQPQISGNGSADVESGCLL